MGPRRPSASAALRSWSAAIAPLSSIVSTTLRGPFASISLRRALAAFSLPALFLAGCAAGEVPGAGGDNRLAPADRSSPAATTREPESAPATAGPEAAGTVDPALINPRVTEFDSYLPPQLIRPDGIPPVYEPEFAAAPEAPLKDDELVIGIELEGRAKAYPITVLRFREMVNDELAGWPILVTW